MKFVSWNVNGLRACIQKDFLNQFQQLDADFFCLQETKLSEGQLKLDLPGYEQYWCYAEKKGYSGTAIFTKHRPLSVTYGIGVPELDNEGRVITLEYREFYLVTCYTPNAQRGLARLDHRMNWDEAFRNYLKVLDAVKPVVICGDLNVAHQEIDLKNPASNHKNAGFSDEERQSFQNTLDSGFTDTFRHLYPDVTGRYSWWSYMFNARENNAGWRIDYFLVSDRMQGQIQQADILNHILGSDHCPVTLELDTLVNGAIWSPDAGTPSVIETETTKKKSKKASPVNGKALVLLCLVIALVAGLFAIPFLMDDDGPVKGSYFAIYSENAFNLIIKEDPLMIHSSTLYHNDRIHVGRKTYYTDNFQTSTLSGANFYLRVELTAMGRKAYSGSMPNLWCVGSVLDAGVTQNTISDVVVTPYYGNENHEQLEGLLIWGILSKSDTIRISFEEFEDSAYVTLEVPEIITPQDYFNIQSFYQPPILMNIKGHAYSLLAFGDAGFYVDSNTSAVMEQIQNAKFWVVVTLTRSSKALLGDELPTFSCELLLKAGIATKDIEQIPIYYGGDPHSIIGCLFYFNASANLKNITATTKNKSLVYPDTIVTYDYYTREEAAQMTTTRLVDKVFAHKGITDTLKTSDISPATAGQLATNYPIIAELFSRNFAVEQILAYPDPLKDELIQLLRYYNDNIITPLNLVTVTPYYRPLAVESFSHYGYYAFSDGNNRCIVREDVESLLDNSSCWVKVYFPEDFDPSIDRNHITWSTDGTTFSVPFYSMDDPNVIAGYYIFGESDTSYIAAIYSGDTLLYGGETYLYPYIRQDEAAKMTTQELAQHVLTNAGIHEDRATSFVNHSSKFMDLYLYYPALAELSKRSDAITELQAAVKECGVVTQEMADYLCKEIERIFMAQ